MTKTTDMIQPTQRKKFILAQHWIFIIILLAFLLLSGSQVILASSSYTSVHWNMLVEPGLSSTATAKATSTSEPTATKTPTPSSTPPATIWVSGARVNLRTGPGTSFSVIQKLAYDEQLQLLGRLSDNTWLYVKTSDGQEGWITVSWVDLSGINLDYDDYPVKTPTPSSTSPATIWVSGARVNLRTGPGTNFSVIQKLAYDEQLQLLGRLSDNTWLYVKTSDGQEGWITVSWVDLSRINLDYDDYPVKTPSPAPPATIWVSGARVNLRRGPGTNFSVIQKLTYDEQLQLLGRLSDNTWLYVKTSDGQEGWITVSWVHLPGINLEYDDYPVRMSPPTETSTPVVLNDIEGHWIDIDLSEQVLRAYDGTDLVATFLVSTGIDLYPTETGQYHIYVKYRYSTMSGSDYYLPNVPYSMYYSGDFSIHGTYWHHNFGTPMSHGCVNMDTSDAEWLYYWSSIGTLVNIHR